MFKHNPLPFSPTLTQKNIRGARFYETDTGKRYPSVTTVLSCVEKPGLEAWKKAMGPNKAKKEADRCSKRGTAVHEIIEHYLYNEEDYLEGRDQELQRLFNRIRLRLNKIDNIKCLEQYLYSDTLQMAGCVDCIGEYDGTLSVIDFKTSNGSKHEDMIQDYFLQCTAYAIMYSELYSDLIEDIVVIITPEKSNTMPMVFKRKIHDYIAPLLQRIDEFKAKQNG